MEYLAQKSSKYFYIVLLVTILFHLVDTVLMLFKTGYSPETFVLILLSIINIMLLGNSIHFNRKQKFTECKVNAKILRFTIAPLLILHTVYTWDSINLITLRDNIMALSVIELVLGYRINCIEYLERMANQFAKENMINLKEDK